MVSPNLLGRMIEHLSEGLEPLHTYNDQVHLYMNHMQ
jgi:hypothetical protein